MFVVHLKVSILLGAIWFQQHVEVLSGFGCTVRDNCEKYCNVTRKYMHVVIHLHNDEQYTCVPTYLSRYVGCGDVQQTPWMCLHTFDCQE